MVNPSVDAAPTRATAAPLASNRLLAFTSTRSHPERILTDGTLDATLLDLINRNLVDRSTLDLGGVDIIKPLFPDRPAEMRRYFHKTGGYLINHTVVIKRELYERRPWLALNLFHAFVPEKRCRARNSLL